MSYVIFDERNGKILHHFDTMRGAKSSFTRRGYANDPDMTVSNIDHYRKTGYVKANTLVTVYSIFDREKKNPIKIRLIDRGTCCDPSTESYHSM